MKFAAGLLAAIVATATAVAVVTPPSGLVTDGIPAIPQSVADGVRPYSDFRPAVLAGWHPTRREALILARSGETAQVHELRAPADAPRQLTSVAERVGDASWPRHRDDYFVFVADHGGDEAWQMYRKDLATGTVTLLSDGGPSQNLPGPWSNAGDLLAFGSTRRNGVDRDVYVMDPRDPSTTRRVLEVIGAGWNPLGWSPDDRRLVVLQYVSAVESFLWSVDVTTGEMTAITPLPREAQKVRTTTGFTMDPRTTYDSGSTRRTRTGTDRTRRLSYAGAQWSPDGKRIYTATDRDFEFKRLAYIELRTGRHHYLTTHLRWDVDQFALAPDGRRIAFTTNEGGASALRMLDTATGKELPAPVLPHAGLVGDLHWHNDGWLLGFTLTGARTPGDVYGLEVDTGRLTLWIAGGTGRLDASLFPEPEYVQWPSFDRQMISGLLYRPPARFAGLRPVLVILHGGPEGQSRPGFLASANYFVQEMGVAVLLPNVRGSTGYGKTFVSLDDRTRREDAVGDVGALLDWIARRKDLDATRVMLTGGSYGGYLSLAAAARFGSRVCCVMSIAGVSNFVSFLEATGDYRRDFRRLEYGDERDPSTRRYLQRISPLTNARDIRRPLFVVQGRNDPRVPYSEAEQLVATVKGNGAPVWYLVANDEGHGFSKKSNQDFQFLAMVEFVRAYLAPPMP